MTGRLYVLFAQSDPTLFSIFCLVLLYLYPQKFVESVGIRSSLVWQSVALERYDLDTCHQ